MSDCTSINQLAKACGVTHRAASQWLKKPGFPVQREAPWSDDDVAEIQAWRKANLAPNRADPEYRGRTATEPPPDDQTKDYWLMRKYRAQALEAEGELLDASYVRREHIAAMAAVRSAVMETASSIAHALGKPDESHIVSEHLAGAIDSIADRLEHAAEVAADSEVGGEGVEDAAAVEPLDVG